MKLANRGQTHRIALTRFVPRRRHLVTALFLLLRETGGFQLPRPPYSSVANDYGGPIVSCAAETLP
jgi:transposase